MPAKILKLIENVDPEDSGALYEIDGAVHSFLYDTPACRVIYLKRTDGKNTYTRSRDALKAIRPEGLLFTNGVKTNMEKPCKVFGYWCDIVSRDFEQAGHSEDLPTEELAELHAIIQAIQWERENGK